ncbi:MAG TPA: hypothetical protein PK048_04385, partial [Candidatus Absconditabacterales bacterium]|nr:hypothetical protein [Candidatus Absconditabacterales bacterium]
MSLSPGSRSAFGSLSPKQYTDFVTRELFHFLISKKVSNGYTKDLTKEFLTTYLTNSLNNTTKPSLGENDNISVGQQYEPGSDQPTNHTDNTGQTSGPGAMKISKKHRKNPLIAFTTEEEIEQAISNTTKNNLSSIVDELTELIHSSQADIQSFISGMREYRTIDDARQAIKHYDSMISERRISIMLRGGGPTTADSEYIKYCGGEIKNIEILIQKKLQFQETSAVTNYYRRRDIAHRTRRDEFIIFEERETKINKAIDHLTRGEHCLIEGPTGTGKTVIAKEIAARVEKRLGKTAYIADGPTISKINSPEKFNEIMNKIVRLYSGHSRSNAQDLAVKLGMEGDIEIVEQLVGMLRAIHEGVPFIIDEIDLIPTETLMSIKALFTLKPGQWTIPDSGTGTIAYHIPRKPMLIATMNGASDKHKRNKLDPAMLRLFDHQDTLGYLDTEKTYDYLVGQLFNEHDYIDGVALNEIKDTANGIIPNLCKFIDMVNQSYQGKKPIPMPALVTGVSSLQQGFLKDKVIEMQKLTTILSGFRIQSTENSLTQYVKSEILSRCLGHANPEDTALLLRAAVIHGLIDYNPTSDHNDIKQSSLILGKTIIDHKHGWTEKTLTDLFADHSNNPRVVRNQSDNLLINAYQIGLQDYVTDPTNPQATSNKPKLEIGYHKETIEQLELIKQQLGTIAATDSINTISTWIKTITQPDNLTKPRTDSIGEDKRKGLIDSVFNTMKKKYKIKENTTDNTKKDDTKKEHDIWNVIKSLDGLTGYVEDIFKDERYKESPPPPPPLDHTPSGFSYQIKEYPLDTTTEQGKRILGIRNNFLDGIKRKDAQGNFVVDQPRNQKIIDIGNKLINQGLFKIHQTSYNGHTIPVFSFRRSPTEPRISFTTTQHMISLDQATERNNDPANNDKPKLDTTDFTHRTPGNNIDYKVTTMNYNDIKNRSSQGIGSLPYGDHLQNMATGLGTEGGVTIEVEHKPDGYFRTMILPVLSAISGYAIPTQGISSDLLGVLNYLTGGTGRFYCDNTNSYVLLKVDDRCLNQFGLDDCALCAKVTWPTSPEGEGKLDYGLITQDLLRKKYQEKNLPLPPAYIYINGTYIDENGQEVPKSIVAKQPISFIAMTITNQDTKQSDFHERVFVRNKETIKKLYKMFGVNYKSFKEGQTK